MKSWFFRVLLVLILLPGVSWSQALPSNTQRAVAGVIQQKMANRGFASNDPRWGATLQGAGATIAGYAAAAAVVTAAGVTAPAWVTAAAVMVVGGLFAAGIDLAIDGIRWAFNSDGTVSKTTTSGPPTLAAGECFWAFGQCRGSLADLAAYYSGSSENPSCGAPDQYGNSACMNITFRGDEIWIHHYRKNSNGDVFDESDFSPGRWSKGPGTPPAVVTPDVPQVVTVRQSVSEAVAALTPSDLAKAANPAVIAAMVNSAWQTASTQPGYTGVPYDASSPVTAQDVSTWITANPGLTPTVANLVMPQGVPVGGTSATPFILPNAAADPVTPPVTPPVVNAPPGGVDWAIPATNESIPRMAVPITYTPTIFASATGCPASVGFAVFGTDYQVSYQPMCDLMSTVAPFFLALGAAAAALIFAAGLKS